MYYNYANYSATLTPSTSLMMDTTYTVVVHGGSNTPVIKDPEGDAMAANFTSTFTTDAAGSGDVAVAACEPVGTHGVDSGIGEVT